MLKRFIKNNLDFVYIGDLDNNELMINYGKLWCKEFSYHGNFYNNNFNGLGVLTFENDIKYDGNFKDGEFNGYGILYYNNSEYYEGEFFKGKENGYGTLYFKNKIKSKGIWNLGILEKTEYISNYYDNDNLKYNGKYRDNTYIREGNGTSFLEDGTIEFEGIFNDNKFSNGKLYYNNKLLFNGTFDEKENFKQGIIYHENGFRLCEKINFVKKNKDLGEDNDIYYLIGNNVIYDSYGKKYFEGELINEIKLDPILDNLIDIKFINTIKLQTKWGKIEIIYIYGSGKIYKYPSYIKTPSNINLNENNKLHGDYTEIYDSNNLKKLIKFDNGIICYYNEYYDVVSDNKQFKLKTKIIFDNNIKRKMINYSLQQNKNDIKYAWQTVFYTNIIKIIKYKKHDLKIYEGECDENLNYTRGNLYNSNGNLEYNGNFKNNKKHGYGISYYNNESIEYHGMWNNNLKHGEGILYDHEGHNIFSGKFYNGEID